MSKLSRFHLVTFGLWAIASLYVVEPGAAGDDKPPFKLEGTWKYQSFRPQSPPTTDPKDQSFAKWSPEGTFTVTKDGEGKLEFYGGKLTLDVKFTVKPGNPSLVSFSATGLGGTFTNELQGGFVPAKPGDPIAKSNPWIVRGSIIQTSEDPKKEAPKYTTGFFVLEPK